MRIADSIAAALATGSDPATRRTPGHTCVFGSAPKVVGQPQNIFVAVPSSTCTSMQLRGVVGRDDVVELHELGGRRGHAPNPIGAGPYPNSARAPLARNSRVHVLAVPDRIGERHSDDLRSTWAAILPKSPSARVCR